MTIAARIIGPRERRRTCGISSVAAQPALMSEDDDDGQATFRLTVRRGML
jgi:hypothetical protein